MKKEAIQKITAELAAVKGDKYYNALKKPVADALTEFCNQSEEFAQAVAQSDKSLTDCLASVCKGIGSSISDIEVYRRAAAFYFPGCVIDMVMSIRMSEYDASPAETAEPDTAPAEEAPADEAPKPEEKPKKPKTIDISLMDLL